MVVAKLQFTFDCQGRRVAGAEDKFSKIQKKNFFTL
jgi:hypothetical protein